MDFGKLARSVAGRVIGCDDADYEPTRRALVWNQLAPQRRPDVIVRVASVPDVVATVDFARGHGLRLAVRSGGHAWSGAALRDGGLLVDVANLDAIEIDGARATAAVGPGAVSLDLARRLAPDGFAFPLGHCGSVRVGGYLLGGGVGWNSGAWGPACAGIEAVEVVTADGRMLRATADEHPDLFWAARGGGVAFCGVAVGFHLRLRPLPRAIVTSTFVHPIDATEVVARFADGATRLLAPNIESTIVLKAGSASGGSSCTLTATAFCDEETTARTALAPLAACPAPSTSRFENQATPFDSLYQTIGEAYPERHRYLADAMWSDAPATQVLAAIREQVARAPSAQSHVLCTLLAPMPLPDGALSMAARLYVASYAVWSDPADDIANAAWHRSVTGALAPFAAGYYVGESDVIGDATRARRCFAPAARAQLADVRRAYDPAGLFHTVLDD
jgi:FAD/FMN-containing dehydrogenase